MEARALIISCLLMAATVPVYIVSPNLAWSANADDPIEPDNAFRISAHTSINTPSRCGSGSPTVTTCTATGSSLRQIRSKK